MIGFVNRARERVSRAARNWSQQAPARRFMSFARQRWPHPPSADRDSVVLVGLFPSNPSIFCYAYTVNALAEKFGSRIESYQFIGRVDPHLRRLYESFGARFALNLDAVVPMDDRIQAEADGIMAGLTGKWNVMQIAVDGVLIGDQIYDSYLRFYAEPTVRIDDPRLRSLVVQALRIFYATREYLARTKVSAFITDDFSYINSGIITRLMFLAEVPTYIVCFGDPFWLLKLDMNPSGAGHQYPPPVGFPYYAYRQLFAELPEEEKTSAMTRARCLIEERLAGKFCPHVRMHDTTYALSSERVLQDGPEPRILIMMHDFVDSPHGYRYMHFPDFYEWITFLLDRAEKTPFRWYVKPHPCMADPSRSALSLANDRVVAELQERYPTINFLPPGTSNLQILNDGVKAMFTVHGTSGHEYAYRGVPVVNCGDNPHIAYDFNINPKNLEEYEACIFGADRLQVKVEQRDIEEFIYMHYLYLKERLGSPVNPIDERLFRRADWPEHLSRPAIFDELIDAVTPERERGVAEYFDRLLSQQDIIPKK